MKDSELLKLKEEIEEAKDEISQLKGQRKALIVQLKQELGAVTVEEAEKKLAKLVAERDALREKKDKAKEELEEKYFRNED